MSEVREGYKKTEFGEVPCYWEIKRVEDVFDNYGGTSLEKEFSETGKYKVISIGSYGRNSRYIDQGIRVNGQGKALEKILNKDDLVMVLNDKTLQGNIIGRTLLIDTDDEYVYNQRSERLVPKFGFSKYYWYFLNSDLFRNKVIGIAQGGTQIYVNFPQIKLLKILIPSLVEQQKIASILSTVDEQIDETEQLIVKTKELKKGLMQQLLTKGIGHTEFKQTELGEIPSEWRVLNLNNIAEVIMGQSPNSNSYNELKIGLPFYQGKSEFGKRYPIPVKWCSEPTKIAEKNDILISVRAPVGEVNICQGISCIGRGLAAIRATKESCNLFLYYSLQLSKEALNKMSQGSTFTAINGAELKNLPLAVPTKVEQQKIASILSTVDSQIEAYEEEKVKYEELKKGLMQKLLTGQIRVKC